MTSKTRKSAGPVKSPTKRASATQKSASIKNTRRIRALERAAATAIVSKQQRCLVAFMSRQNRMRSRLCVDFGATGHYVFLSLDADALARVLGCFALGDASPGHIAIDGKTLKGSRRHDAKALHVLSAFASELSAVAGDLVVEPESNEITAALALLKGLPLEGAIITGDAIFCQREICGISGTAEGTTCSR